MKNNIDIILKGSVFKMVCKLSLPNFLGVSSMPIIIFMDAFFISKLGNIELASLALVFPFLTVMQMMSAGAIGGATTSSISRHLGKSNISGANSAAWHAIIIAIVLSLIYSIFFLFFPDYIFIKMGAKGDVLEYAIWYAQVSFGGAIFIWLVYIFSAIFRAIGDVITPAIVQIIGCFFQIIFAGTLTLGWFGFSSIGIIGPAVAMVISHFIMALYLMFNLQLKQKIIKLTPCSISLRSFKDIMKVGGGGLINSVTIAGTVAVVTAAVSKHGVEALAGYGLGSRLEIIITPLVFGIGSVLTASVGINVGAQQLPRAKMIAWTGAFISFCVVGLLGATVTIFPDIWLNNFESSSLIRDYATSYLIIVAPFYCFFAAGQTLYFASQGLGKIFYPVIVGIIRLLSVSIICYYVTIYDLSLKFVFYGVSFGLLATGLGLWMCMLGPDWKKQI